MVRFEKMSNGKSIGQAAGALLKAQYPLPRIEKNPVPPAGGIPGI